MAEISTELKKKIHRVLGIPPADVASFDLVALLDELCETVIMLDEGNVVAQLTALREKLTAINGRIWNLLGQHDPKKARENLGGIAELERYVGEVKRRSGQAEEEPEPEKPAPAAPSPQQSENAERLAQLEMRVNEVQQDLQNLFDTLMDVEALEEEARDLVAKKATSKSERGTESPTTR